MRRRDIRRRNNRTVAFRVSFRMRSTCLSFLLHSRGRKSREFSRFAQHLVNFSGMQLLGVDHLPCELLQGDEASLYKAEQFPVELERAAFGLQRFAQHRREVMLMRVEEGPDLQRWISPQRGNPLSDLLSMQ